MKKKRNVGFVYFFVFMFLGFLLISTTGVYDNAITGAVIDAGRIGDTIQGAFQLITLGIVAPLFGELIGESSIIVIRFLLWLILFMLISDVFPNKENKISKGTVKVISAIIPLIGVAFLPEEFISALGYLGAFFIAFGLIIFGYYHIYKFSKDKLDLFIKFIKIFLSFLMIILLSIMTPWFEGVFGTDLGDLYYLAITLGTVMGIILIIYFILQRGEENKNNYSSNRKYEESPPESPPSNDFDNEEQNKDEIIKKNNLKGLIIGTYNAIKSRYGYIMRDSKDIRNFKKIIKNLKDIKEYSTSINSNIEFSGLKNKDRNFNLIFNLCLKIEKDSDRLISEFKKVRETISFKTLLVRLESTIGKTIRYLQSPINNL